MLFNSMQREPYHPATYSELSEIDWCLREPRYRCCIAVVARVVRCWVKSVTSATLVLICQRVEVGLWRLPVTNRRKVGTTSSHHGPYGVGYKRATMGSTKGCEPAMVSESQKTSRSPDWSATRPMKSESLVIANQNVAVNTFPGLVHTTRHTMEVDCTRSN